MKARNMLINIDGLGVAWYTSSSADFERGNTVRQHIPFLCLYHLIPKSFVGSVK